MHLTVAFNSGDVQADRLKIYCNGKRVTDLNVTTAVPASYQGRINSQATHFIGKHAPSSGQYYNGLMGEVHFIDGLALAPDGVFGEFDAATGVWVPIEYTGEYRFAVNQAQTWSSFGGSGTYSANYNWTKLFDSDPDSKTVPANGSSITADFTSLSGGGIAYTSSLEVHYRRNTNAPDVTVNGSGISAPNNGADNIYKVSGSGTLTSVGTQQRTTAGAGDCSLFRIVIDGEELVDAGVTPNNNGFHLDFSDNSSNAALGNDAVGSNNWTVNNLSVADGASVSVASASGALPIYNTTDTYGQVGGSGFRTDAYASNLVLALAFDSLAASGQVSDVHATIKGSGSNKVSYHNASTTTTQSKYYGNAGYFDGSQADNVTHATSTDFEFGTGDWTVEGWFYPTNISGDKYLVSWTTPNSANGGPNAAHAGINIYNSNWRIGGFNGQLYNGNEGLAANTWVHVAMAREGNTLRIFINGKLVASPGVSGIDFDSTSGMTLAGMQALPISTMTAT